MNNNVLIYLCSFFFNPFIVTNEWIFFQNNQKSKFCSKYLCILYKPIICSEQTIYFWGREFHQLFLFIFIRILIQIVYLWNLCARQTYINFKSNIFNKCWPVFQIEMFNKLFCKMCSPQFSIEITSIIPMQFDGPKQA